MKKPRIVIPDLFFAGLLIILTIASFISYKRIISLNNASDLVNHTNLVTLKLNQVAVNLTSLETNQRGYLLTGDSSFLADSEEISKQITANIHSIDSLTIDNIVEQQNIAAITPLIYLKKNVLIKNITLYKQGPVDGEKLKASISNGKKIMDEIKSRMTGMIQIENGLLRKREEVKDYSAYISPIYSLLFSLVAIAIVSFAYIRLRREIHLRFRAQENVAKIQLLQQTTKESEMLFRNIADTAPVLIWLAGTDKMRYFFNKGWLAFTGRAMEEETGTGWMVNIHTDDIAKYQRLYAESFDEHRDFNMEYRLKRKDGKYRWMSDRSVPRYTPNEEFIGYTGTCMDIEEQKNFSQELENKVATRTAELKTLNEVLTIKNEIFAHAEENALLGSYTWNLDKGTLEYSDNLFRLFGCEPNEFVPTFETYLGFIHPDDKAQVIKDGEETFATHQLVEHVYRVITKQGLIKYFRSSGKFVDKKNEKLLVGAVQDITKDVLLNESLSEKNLELERNNTELASFNYIASHDLQEPLRKIQTFSKLIEVNELNNLSVVSNDYFSRIITSAGRMQKLLEALLSYSKASPTEIQFVSTNLNNVLEEVKNNLHDLLEAKQTIIERDDLPTLNLIPLQFYQLFSNLISNAVKYSRPGIAPHIKITTQVVSSAEIDAEPTIRKGEYWKISFADNGIGFDQQYSHKIFELFQRLHDKNEYDGTGIGLAICRKIVRNHSGFINAMGIPGEGSVFNIFLPL